MTDLIWRDISKEIESCDSKANPFGWSSIQIYFRGERIGSLYCGYPDDFKDNFKAEIRQEGDHKRLCVEAGFSQEDWDALDFVKGYKPVGGL